MRIPLALTAVLFLSASLHADVWDDDALDRDDGTGTRNELLHGSVQVHDLASEAGGPDQDWYRIAAQPYSSYEVVVDGITGDVGSLRLELLASDGTTVLATGFAREPGGLTAKAVRQSNQTTSPVTWFVRVDGAPACGASCTTADQYTIRLYNTTAHFARFDNTGTKRTTLYLQNTSGVFGSSALLTYWDANGTCLTSCVFDLRAKSSVALDTSGCGGAARAGSMSVDVRLPFGALTGKATEVDAASGRVLETPLVLLPH
jgi:hypothetical protein